MLFSQEDWQVLFLAIQAFFVLFCSHQMAGRRNLLSCSLSFKQKIVGRCSAGVRRAAGGKCRGGRQAGFLFQGFNSTGQKRFLIMGVVVTIALPPFSSASQRGAREDEETGKTSALPNIRNQSKFESGEKANCRSGKHLFGGAISKSQKTGSSFLKSFSQKHAPKRD